MEIRIFLIVFFSVINLPSKIYGKTTRHYIFDRCLLVDLENDYYALFGEDDTSRHFLGVCDSDASTKRTPCPFESSITVQCPSSCTPTVKIRQSEPIPALPTCILGEHTPRCLPMSRRNARSAPTINNCIRCMTKHPNAGIVQVGSLRRVKRGVITPPSMQSRSGTINQQKLWRSRHSRLRSCSFSRKYQRQVPAAEKNKNFRTRELLNDDVKMERNSDNALVRILRKVSNKKITRRSNPQDEEIEDDDEDEDDSADEDIAIEEDDHAETEIPTTEKEKDELRAQQKTNENFTEDINSGESKTSSSHKIENNSSKRISTTFINVFCTLILVTKIK